MERVMGIEPTLAAWEAAVLPLNYTRESWRFYGRSPKCGNTRANCRPVCCCSDTVAGSDVRSSWEVNGTMSSRAQGLHHYLRLATAAAHSNLERVLATRGYFDSR